MHPSGCLHALYWLFQKHASGDFAHVGFVYASCYFGSSWTIKGSGWSPYNHIGPVGPLSLHAYFWHAVGAVHLDCSSWFGGKWVLVGPPACLLFPPPGLTAIVQYLLASGWLGNVSKPLGPAGGAPTHCAWSILGV